MAVRRSLVALAALVLTLSASWSSRAHETMEPDWCSRPHEEIKIVETFNLSGKEVYALVEETHGVVDSPRGGIWNPVSIAIGLYCEERAHGLDSRAIITGPKSYLSPKHHELYRIDDGLVGGCGVCMNSQN